MGHVFRIVNGLIVLALLCCSALADSSFESLARALDSQDQWLATSTEGAAWNEYLLTDELRSELSKPSIDRRMLARIVGRYESGVSGLQHPRFVSTRKSLEVVANRTRVPMSVRWAEQIRSAGADPAPIDDMSVIKARIELQDAAEALNQILGTADPARRDGWKTFLKWNDLDNQLAMGSPNWKTLEGVGAQFFNGHPGLEYPEFVRVREALRKYLYLGSMGSNGKGQRSIKAQMDALADSLEKYNRDPSTKNAGEVASLLDWLDQLDRVPVLASEIRAAHMMPNIKLRVSEDLLSRRFTQSVNEPMQVNEDILGTHVIGTAITRGLITTDVVSNANSARIDIVFRGTTQTNSVGRQKPVTIQSTSVTALEARKPLFVFPRQITSGKSVATGRTTTTIHSITPDRRLGRRIVQKIAWKKAGQQKAHAEQIASTRAARRLEQQLDDQSNELLTRAQQTLREQLRGPINRRGLIPESIATHSLDRCVIVTAKQADKSQFAATTEPPMFCPHDDVVAQVHESALNNTAEKAIAGLTLTDERIAELTKEVTGSVPDELKITEDSEPWSISFDWQQPVTFEFENESLKIAVRGRRFTSGDRTLNKVMEMSATYRMKVTSTGVNLVRQGDIEVRFPNNKEGARLRPLDIPFKTLMQNKFAEVFKPEIQGEGFSLPGRFEALGTIRLNDLSADNGWLSLGWQ